MLSGSSLYVCVIQDILETRNKIRVSIASYECGTEGDIKLFATKNTYSLDFLGSRHHRRSYVEGCIISAYVKSP